MNRGERGSATPMALALMMLSAFALVAGVLVVQLIATHRAAQNAADLAALAAASEIQQGAPPCRAAATIADRNHTRLLSCHQTGDEVEVVVGASASAPGADLLTMKARARAGPVLSGE